jgi:hypothetical protein
MSLKKFLLAVFALSFVGYMASFAVPSTKGGAYAKPGDSYCGGQGKRCRGKNIGR